MVHSPGRMSLQTKSLFCPEQFVVVSVFGRHLFIVGIVVDFRIRVSPAVRHICDGTGHFGEDQAGRIAGTSDVTPCLATGQETEMQPLLGNDSIQLVCIFRAVPFGSSERGCFFGSGGIIPACVFTRTYRVVIVVKRDGLADSLFELFFRFCFILCHSYPIS